MLDRKDGGRLRLERRQVLQIVVDRLQRPVRRILQDAVHPSLQLAGEHAHAHVERRLEVGLQFRQHGEAAGDMESADHHRHAGRPERAGDVERAGILVRLHADDRDQAEPAVAPKLGEQLVDFDAGMDLVDHRDVDGGVGSEHGPLRRIAPQAVEHGERVRGDERAHPLDDVAVVVVMRRLDQDELEAPLRPRRCTCHTDLAPSHPTSGRCASLGATVT